MNDTALMIIDVQKGLDNPLLGDRNNPQAESNIARLLADWRDRKYPVIHIQHNSVEPGSLLRPDSPGNAIKEEAMPLVGEKLICKTVNSAFIGTELEDYLHSQGIESLVVAGLTTDHCVSTTVRMASNLGFEVTLVSDATATFERNGCNGENYSAEDIHNINLACLNGEFCIVRSTGDVLQNIV